QTQIQRVKDRDHLTQEEAERIIDSQLSREDRLALADDVIVNNQDEHHLQKQVLEMHQYYLNLFS
ncbi:MAG: dephospho-CoA kinase, partial [Neisseriaceae bacterium]|nr:dephospho-CoA kinase [Neisseriaceae bacterium]